MHAIYCEIVISIDSSIFGFEKQWHIKIYLDQQNEIVELRKKFKPSANE